MHKLRITKDCFCQHYFYNKTYSPREDLIEKKLKKGDIVEFVNGYHNLFGDYFIVKKDEIIYDILPEYLEPIK